MKIVRKLTVEEKLFKCIIESSRQHLCDEQTRDIFLLSENF